MPLVVWMAEGYTLDGTKPIPVNDDVEQNVSGSG